jgi:hypothetical protein
MKARTASPSSRARAQIPFIPCGWTLHRLNLCHEPADMRAPRPAGAARQGLLPCCCKGCTACLRRRSELTAVNAFLLLYTPPRPLLGAPQHCGAAVRYCPPENGARLDSEAGGLLLACAEPGLLMTATSGVDEDGARGGLRGRGRRATRRCYEGAAPTTGKPLKSHQMQPDLRTAGPPANRGSSPGWALARVAIANSDGSRARPYARGKSGAHQTGGPPARPAANGLR